ncbi:MAG TPA: AMP-binding protein [Petrimonas sp.]|uniref:AMP-binding protein n=1 Tax=Petrimonas sp. TaxID=2023866 RepID=UPI00095B3046|nr:AMP-binding protein [Petrimonas sp.]OJV39076.1 MAG: AMP-binding protein [Bacteroidia bacterium 43-41]MEA4949715.1 AMP-binding protein [Petrimonas sp.]MEA4980449.1 AMP-binding protein [Petrimonas sp.]MEA5044183.1 AMP-binding protein [Petrimonas sp.]
MQLFEKTLGDWLEYWAKETPDKEYIVYSDRNLRFTWKTFDERVNNMANGLLSIGVTRGTNVGIWAQNVPDWLTVLYATAKIGAVAVTVNTNYKTEELAFVLKNSDMHTLCLTEGIPGSDYIDMIYELLPELRTTQRGKLKSERFPETRNVVYIGQEKFRGMYNTAELLLVGANRPKDEFWSLRKQTNCHDTVNMQYTSGTTGFPKGVMLSHHNIANNGYLTGVHMKFTPEDKCCVCVPLFHCFGVVLATMCCLTHGSTQVMVERFDPLLVLASIHKERCTVLHGVPTMFIAELNHPMFSLFDMGSLRTGIMAGSLCPIELMKQVNEKMFMDVTSVYGLTEASPGMTQTRVDDPFGVRCTTVGRAYEFTDVKVLDPATGIECPAGIEGEMCCRGYNVMKGYYKNPEATAQVIDANGYLHSGDLGVKDENGNYRITGRIKDMIIRGGENISPKEVEDFLYKMPEIKDVQVVAVASSRYGEDVGAFIILKDGKELTREDVRDFCKDHIARYKIPRYVFFINQFPMTGSGKIQKFRLRQLALEMCEADEIEII